MGKDISSIEELLSHDSFVRWVRGRAMPSEARRWDSWIKDNPRNREMAKKAQETLLGFDFLADESTAVNKQKDWNSLEKRIGRESSFKKKSYYSVNKKSKTGWIFRVAVLLLIAATTGFAAHLYFSGSRSAHDGSELVEWKAIDTEFSQQKTIALSDGSTITLNANSSITYPAGWVRGNVTEVYLEGEAYFSIVSREKGEAPPFNVITDHGVIEVMGTKFVVATTEKDTRVGLEKGKISIQKKDSQNDSSVSKKYVLEPNEIAHYSREIHEVTISSHPNMDVFTSWVDQKIVLDSSPLSYLIYRIEHTFGVEVNVYDKNLYERRLTGTLKIKDLDHLVKSISDVMGVEVSLEKGTVHFGKS
ncbi:MAG: FecR domain-containing protein [Balneolaceae bacterium]|nr:FecR domain-containing protein [Balneolaceae bacterium]